MMMRLDDLILEVNSLLQSILCVKKELEIALRHHRQTENPSKRRTRPATPTKLVQLASKDPFLGPRQVLDSIISRAGVLREQLPPSPAVQQLTTLPRNPSQVPVPDTRTTHSSNSSPRIELPRIQSTSERNGVLEYEEAEQLERDKTEHSREEVEQNRRRARDEAAQPSPAPSSILSSSEPGLMESLNKSIDDRAQIEQDGRSVAGLIEGSQASSRDEQDDTDMSARDGSEFGDECLGRSDDVSKLQYPTNVTILNATQMKGAMVPALETVVKAKPGWCYDKIEVAGFVPPDFSQATLPEPGYMRGCTFIKDGHKVTALTIETTFTFPHASTLNQKYSPLSQADIRSYFQSVCDSPPAHPVQYFVGPIPQPPNYVPLVHAGPKLCLRNSGKIPGVNTPFWYISQCEKTPATLHIEDGNLGSVNLLLAGAPKLWLLIPASEKPKLESRMKQLHGRRRFACSQEIRHFNAIIPPALLEEWGITYYLDYCLAGEMMVTRPKTYHQVINMGPNVAESVNIEFSDSADMPRGYVWCRRGKGSGDCGRFAITAREFELHSPAMKMKKRRSTSQTLPKAKKVRTKTSLETVQEDLVCGRFSYTCVYEKFSKTTGDTMDLLTRLFFAIASPKAVCELRVICHLRRRTNGNALFPHGKTTDKTMEALDKVDQVISACAIVRRYYLMRLTERRNQLLAIQQKHKCPKSRRPRNDAAERIRRVDSLALDDLYEEAYGAAGIRSPELREKLRNRLRHGRNWLALSNRFSLGVLALISNDELVCLTKVETVKEQEFELFLNILDQERGEFLRQICALVESVYDNVLFHPKPIHTYSFEKVEEATITQTTFDSTALLSLCTHD